MATGSLVAGAVCAVLVAAWLAWGPLRPGGSVRRRYDAPVLDFSRLRRNHQGRFAAVEQLASAASEFGLVRLVNHDVDVESARRHARQYFQLAIEKKNCPECSVRNATVGYQRGYIPFAAESGLASVLEAKEGFCYGYDWPESISASHPFQTPNVWPASDTLAELGEDWQPGMQRFFNEAVQVSVDAVGALAEALGEGGSELPRLAQGGETISQMRMFNYLPPSHQCGEGACMGSSPHTDWHFVTIISRDTASALQFADRRTGEWIDVHSEVGELILLIGDWLSAYSQNKYHAPLHRVNSPLKESSVSFVLFFYPGIDARLPDENRNKSAKGVAYTNGVEDLMFEVPWGDYVVHKWAQVMSNR